VSADFLLKLRDAVALEARPPSQHAREESHHAVEGARI